MIKVKVIKPDGPIIEHIRTEKNGGCDFKFLSPNTNVLSKYDLMLKEEILNENVFIWH